MEDDNDYSRNRIGEFVNADFPWLSCDMLFVPAR